jgi:hypothetical protein
MAMIASDPIGGRDGDGSGIRHPLLSAGNTFGVYRRPVQLI